MPNPDLDDSPDMPGSDLRYFVSTAKSITGFDLSEFPEDCLWALIRFEDLIRLAHPQGYGSALPPPWTPGMPPSEISFRRTRKECALRLRGYLSHQHWGLGKPWTQQHEDAWAVLGDLDALLNLLQRIDRGEGGRNDEVASALRSHGRLAQRDRVPTGQWGAPLNPTEQTSHPAQAQPASGIAHVD